MFLRGEHETRPASDKRDASIQMSYVANIPTTELAFLSRVSTFVYNKRCHDILTFHARRIIVCLGRCWLTTIMRRSRETPPMRSWLNTAQIDARISDVGLLTRGTPKRQIVPVIMIGCKVKNMPA